MCPRGMAQSLNLGSFPFRQAGFLLTQHTRQAHDRDGGLHLARTLHEALLLRGNAHGPARQRSARIDAAASVGTQSRAGEVGESFRNGIQLRIVPLVQDRRLAEPWKLDLDGRDLARGSRFNVAAEGLLQGAQPSLQFGRVQNRDGKWPDAAPAAATTARNLPEQRSPSAAEPVIGSDEEARVTV